LKYPLKIQGYDEFFKYILGWRRAIAATDPAKKTPRGITQGELKEAIQSFAQHK
jgi:hypothetical protein